MRPIVGIPCQADFRERSGRPIYGNNRTYIHAVESASGIPVLIPLLHDTALLEPLFAHLDGIVFTGGVDIQPELFGEEEHPELGEVDAQLDDFELALARWALARDMPILGVCRGMQLLNVVMGGNLYQDIAAQCPGSIAHSRRELPRNTLIHNVRVEVGSQAERVLGASEVWVNSLHHQSVKDSGAGVHISGHAEDGVAELLEIPGHLFALGIQCHPEELYATEKWSAHLFAAFVQACSEYHARHTGDVAAQLIAPAVHRTR
jgi:putative glutamine amidotransferase